MADHVINKECSDATNKWKQSVPLAHHHYEAASPAQCNHNLSLLDAGQLAYWISSKTCVNHSTISVLYSKYFSHPHKPSGGCSPKLSAADTHHIQQLISAWKAINAAQIAKTLVYTKNKLLTWYTVHFNPRKADFKVMLKKKYHFSASGIQYLSLLDNLDKTVNIVPAESNGHDLD